jgi:hypothetical protein
MGRLTLNVLLSFAQFERELSSPNEYAIRLPLHAKKGKWTGGSVPLGYDSVDKRLIINEAEAKSVRMIFKTAISRWKVLPGPHHRTRSKTRYTQGPAGFVTRPPAAIPFTYGPLGLSPQESDLRRGDRSQGSWFEGEHQPILDQSTFGRVQELLKSNSIRRVQRPA